MGGGPFGCPENPCRVQGPLEIVELDEDFKVTSRHPRRLGVPGALFSTANLAMRKKELVALGCLDKRMTGPTASWTWIWDSR